MQQRLLAVPLLAICTLGLEAQTTTTRKAVLIGWNDLGMHCMDGKDYSVYSILPPFNNFHAQLIDSSGKLVKSSTAGYTLTYEAVADPTGSINRTTATKTNFWTFAPKLFGVNLAPNMGLAGFPMPGAGAVKMRFDSPYSWFTGEGVPIGPWDDNGVKNYYPMMRLRAKNASGTEVARTNIVLPVSDEMDCTTCHASGSLTTAKPASGWTYYTADKEKDYKFNVLKLHDERSAGSTAFTAALAKAGYNAGGLLRTVQDNATPVLCAKCHGSNALPGTGYDGIRPLTQSMHAFHSNVIDPKSNLTLESNDNRTACYSCHPGSATKCLRGVMGNALNADGTMQMHCQSCHGSMAKVGASTRTGWLQEPGCQNCHTGTAVKNNGQIRYTTALDAAGGYRAPADLTFATNPNQPAAGYSLYRFSKGHGGLQCEACHGATHAEYPTSHVNDNLQSIALQGHAGTLTECATCHGGVAPLTANGGPHGMHTIGQTWVSKHGDLAERSGTGACQACHGVDYRGTVLSTVKANRSFSTEWGTKKFTTGQTVGCYSCHNGPRGG